jgi:hypothetical protein
MKDYLLVALMVFGLNLLPALAPPTWAVLVLLRLNSDLAPVPLVLIGAAAAASGRLVLAVGFRRLSAWLPKRYVINARAAGSMLMSSRKSSIVGLGLFALSPVPSAQLFEAAGLMSVRLEPLVVAFFAGRLASYSLYVGGVSAARNTGLGQLLTDSLTSPWAIGLQVLLLAGLVLLGRIDWAGVQRRHGRRSPGSSQA